MDQDSSDSPGRDGWDPVGEEDPDVRSSAGLGQLQRDGYALGAGRFRVGQGIEHRGRSIEVSGQKMACVVAQQRIQANERVPGQVRAKDRNGKR
jgi:hypothetical protein